MKITKKIEETIQRNQVINVTCNRCAKSIYIGDEWHIKGGDVNIEFGYGSKNDGHILKFELCDDCCDELIKSFLVQPEDNVYV